MCIDCIHTYSGVFYVTYKNGLIIKKNIYESKNDSIYRYKDADIIQSLENKFIISYDAFGKDHNDVIDIIGYMVYDFVDNKRHADCDHLFYVYIINGFEKRDDKFEIKIEKCFDPYHYNDNNNKKNLKCFNKSGKYIKITVCYDNTDIDSHIDIDNNIDYDDVKLYYFIEFKYGNCLIYDNINFSETTEKEGYIINKTIEKNKTVKKYIIFKNITNVNCEKNKFVFCHDNKKHKINKKNRLLNKTYY